LEEGLKNEGFQINTAAKRAFNTHKLANEKAFVKPEGLDAIFNPYTPPEIELTENQINEIAEGADIGVITIGRNAGEGGDRIEKNDFLLSDIEQNMIKNTCEIFHGKGKKVIVVLNVGGVIETASWKSQPDAILLAWQGGQEGGNSVADILNGKITPSGKLPMTFPINLNNHASNSNFPQEGGGFDLTKLLSGMVFGQPEIPEEEKEINIHYTNYDEGIYVGYRHFDKSNMKVSYPFGFGLSFTNFEYTPPEVTQVKDTVTIAFTIQNIGNYEGKEIVQVYVSKPNTTIDRPMQELKAFTKTVALKPEESENLRLRIPISDLRYWDENTSQWVLEKGQYEIKIAASSRDVRSSAFVEF